ncbi:retrovirus-related pol polyprotein from transposon TNT 1-94 [Tanacetum coccineum]
MCVGEIEEGGSRYYVTFINDSSRKVWVYFLKKWKAAVENETNLRVKRLKSDNGGETKSDSSNLTKPNQKDQVVLEDSPENLANKSIVVEHVLSLEITRSPGGSSDTSAGSKNSGSFKDSGRSDEEDSKDGASSEEGGFETP